MLEQYKSDIEEILKQSDLSTITTKKIRKALEQKKGLQLDTVKKEINAVIEAVFMEFQDNQTSAELTTPPSPPVVKKLPKIEKTTQPTIKKPTKKKTADKPKRQPKWPIFKSSAALYRIINSEYCTRPRAVKLIWKYIKDNDLQDKADKRFILCDDNLKGIFDNQDRVNAFGMNKVLGNQLESIPKEEQEKYRHFMEEEVEEAAAN